MSAGGHVTLLMLCRALLMLYVTANILCCYCSAAINALYVTTHVLYATANVLYYY